MLVMFKKGHHLVGVLCKSNAILSNNVRGGPFLHMTREKKEHTFAPADLKEKYRGDGAYMQREPTQETCAGSWGQAASRPSHPATRRRLAGEGTDQAKVRDRRGLRGHLAPGSEACGRGEERSHHRVPGDAASAVP